MSHSTNAAQTMTSSMSTSSPTIARYMSEYKQMMLELRAQNFDVIRFATYRTACKLRFIQKKLNLHLIDLWNVIETFRDNNLHTLDILHEIDIATLEKIVHNMYLQLNKRLAINQHINVDSMSVLLTSWLVNLYDKNRLSRIKLFSFKIALTTLCSGKLIDKLKYVFTQISEASLGSLSLTKFDQYLKELLAIPMSVYEEPSFGYSDNLARTCFDFNTASSAPITLHEFLDTIMSDAAPACFIWLTIFHRMILVQNVIHPVKCSACMRNHFLGFRYKCQRCRNYQLCQDCFWRGRVTASHRNTHQMKEYTSYKSAAKQFSNSLKRSFFCKPKNSQQQKSGSQNNLEISPMSNLLGTVNSEYLICKVKHQNKPPSTPIISPAHEIYKTCEIAPRSPSPPPPPPPQPQPPAEYSLKYFQKPQSPTPFKSTESIPRSTNATHEYIQSTRSTTNLNNDEHHLISLYSNRLADYYHSTKKYQMCSSSGENPQFIMQQIYPPSSTSLHRNTAATRSLSETNFRNDTILMEKKQLVAKLEAQNREIMREINRLRLKQESNRSLIDDENIAPILASRESTPLTIRSGYTTRSYQANSNTTTTKNPYIIAELKTLKQRKGELDSRMIVLEQNRDELLSQLSQLQSLMKPTPPPPPNKAVNLSARSTPIRIVRAAQPQIITAHGSTKYATLGATCTAPQPQKAQLRPSAKIMQMNSNLPNSKYRSVPTSPLDDADLSNYLASLQAQYAAAAAASSCNSSSSNVYSKNLRNDLLVAADSVTSAMHSLVKELNSENEQSDTEQFLDYGARVKLLNDTFGADFSAPSTANKVSDISKLFNMDELLKNMGIDDLDNADFGKLGENNKLKSSDGVVMRRRVGDKTIEKMTRNIESMKDLLNDVDGDGGNESDGVDVNVNLNVNGDEEHDDDDYLADLNKSFQRFNASLSGANGGKLLSKSSNNNNSNNNSNNSVIKSRQISEQDESMKKANNDEWMMKCDVMMMNNKSKEKENRDEIEEDELNEDNPFAVHDNNANYSSNNKRDNDSEINAKKSSTDNSNIAASHQQQQQQQIISNNNNNNNRANQQLLHLDEDVFFFTDSLLTNNEQVASWRKELEQRLNDNNNSNGTNNNNNNYNNEDNEMASEHNNSIKNNNNNNYYYNHSDNNSTIEMSTTNDGYAAKLNFSNHNVNTIANANENSIESDAVNSVHSSCNNKIASEINEFLDDNNNSNNNNNKSDGVSANAIADDEKTASASTNTNHNNRINSNENRTGSELKRQSSL